MARAKKSSENSKALRQEMTSTLVQISGVGQGGEGGGGQGAILEAAPFGNSVFPVKPEHLFSANKCTSSIRIWCLRLLGHKIFAIGVRSSFFTFYETGGSAMFKLFEDHRNCLLMCGPAFIKALGPKIGCALICGISASSHPCTTKC